jgi:hypothetical protein
VEGQDNSIDSATVATGKHTKTVLEQVTNIVTVLWPASHTPDTVGDIASISSIDGTESAGKNTEIVWDEVTSIVTVEWQASPVPHVPDVGTDNSLTISATASTVATQSEGSGESSETVDPSTVITKTQSNIEDKPPVLPETSAHETVIASSVEHDTATQDQPATGVPISGTSMGFETSSTEQLSTSVPGPDDETSLAQSPAEGTIIPAISSDEGATIPTISSAEGEATPAQSITKETPIIPEPTASSVGGLTSSAQSTAQDTPILPESSVTSAETQLPSGTLPGESIAVPSSPSTASDSASQSGDQITAGSSRLSQPSASPSTIDSILVSEAIPVVTSLPVSIPSLVSFEIPASSSTGEDQDISKPVSFGDTTTSIISDDATSSELTQSADV